MPCFKPLHGYVSRVRNPNGKRNTVFQLQQALFGPTGKGGIGPYRRTMKCGQCIGCRLEYSRQWAVRIMHESKKHDYNCFVTLTYDDQNLPENGCLNKKHIQDFIKLLRYHCGFPIRYYHCGEYGEKFKRPHYHLVIFGADFRDGEIIKTKMLDENPYYLYSSPVLQTIWKKGYVTVGELTFESAAYVARYVTKKVNGKKAAEELTYEIIDETTGECLGQRPVEYATMSRRPGIGQGWFDENFRDCYPKDYCTIRGAKSRPPRYYDQLLERQHNNLYQKVKNKRKEGIRGLKDNQDYMDHRLSVREKCQILTAQLLKRSIDSDT